ncbi:putative Mg(2+) transport ATPase [compost metagenome]
MLGFEREHKGKAAGVRTKGLTTAAGLWMTAAIGTAAGMGREATALISTILALLVLGTMPLLVDKLEGQDEGKQEEEEGRKH